MVDSTESTLKQLRKSFQLIFKLSQEWGSTSAQVSRNVRAAANLIPRLRSIPESKAPALGVLAHFHNIRERLCQKHLEQLDLLVRALNAAQASRLELLDQLDLVVEQAFDLYGTQADYSDVTQASARSLLSPSIADYMQWMDFILASYNAEAARSAKQLALLVAAAKAGSLAGFSAESWDKSAIDSEKLQEIFDVSNGKLPAYLSALTEPEGGRVEQKQASGKR